MSSPNLQKSFISKVENQDYRGGEKNIPEHSVSKVFNNLTVSGPIRYAQSQLNELKEEEKNNLMKIARNIYFGSSEQGIATFVSLCNNISSITPVTSS